jgi:hypothetical protein
VLHWPLFVPQYQDSEAGTGWARAYRGQLRGHLRSLVLALRHRPCVAAPETATKAVRRLGIPRSVISAKVKLALRCRSMFSEKTSVLRARSGSPEKKSVSPRCNSGVDRVSFETQQKRRNDGQKHRTPSSSSNIWIDARFRDTGADRRPPLARCRREQARRGHRGLALETRNRRLAKGGERQVRRRNSPPQHVEWQIPMAAAAGACGRL